MAHRRINVLFVCTGNSCRSVMAEKLFAAACREAGLAWGVASCGVAGDPGFAVPKEVLDALKAEGIAPFEHVPSALTAGKMAWADCVFTLTRDQREEVLDRFPDSAAKVHLLRPFTGTPGEDDVADPIGQSPAVYEACCAELRGLVGRLVKRLAAAR